jgi:hypothetical protein
MTVGNAAATIQYGHHVDNFDWKSSIYCCQVILKAKMTSMLQSLTIVMGFDEL